MLPRDKKMGSLFLKKKKKPTFPIWMIKGWWFNLMGHQEAELNKKPPVCAFNSLTKSKWNGQIEHWSGGLLLSSLTV